MKGALKNQIGLYLGEDQVVVRGHNSRKILRNIKDKDGCTLTIISMLQEGEDPKAPHVYMENSRRRKITIMNLSEKGMVELYMGLKELLKINGVIK